MRIATGLKRTLTVIAFAPLVMLGITHAARAGGVYTHADACQQYWNLPATDLLYGVDGLRNQSSVPRYVVCAAPRWNDLSTPYYSSYIDVVGTNSSGAQTSCTIYSLDPYRGVRAAKSFTVAYQQYWQGHWFTAAEMPYYAYVSVLCYLPPNSTGVLRGIRSQ